MVDASVLAAWCFREPQESEVLELLQDSAIHAPFLLTYELTRIARKKATQYPERLNVLSRALHTTLGLDIHWSDVDQLSVLRLAMTTGLTTYDAIYLYLARTLAVPLATFDDSLYWKQPSRGLGRHLGSLWRAWAVRTYAAARPGAGFVRRPAEAVPLASWSR